MTSADALLIILLASTGGSYHPVIHEDKPVVQKIHDHQQVTDDKLGNSPCRLQKQN